MPRRIAVLAIPASVGLAYFAVACAHASPEPPPGPPPPPPAIGATCGGDFDGALTGAGDTRNLLECSSATWQRYDDPYPSSDRWLTTGPELVLHGQGRRNPEIHRGTWTGTPQTADTVCGAETVDVIGPGKTGEPQALTAGPGRPLTVDASDHLFTVRLKGYCLWQRG